jgi:hypothetical protein
MAVDGTVGVVADLAMVLGFSNPMSLLSDGSFEAACILAIVVYMLQSSIGCIGMVQQYYRALVMRIRTIHVRQTVCLAKRFEV